MSGTRATACDDATCTYCHPPELRCAKCSAVVPRIVGMDNPDGGMRLRFEGWYGGTIDPFAEPSVLLCADCATAFLRPNDWLGLTSPDLVPAP